MSKSDTLHIALYIITYKPTLVQEYVKYFWEKS